MEHSLALGLLQQTLRKLKENNGFSDVNLSAEKLSLIFSEHSLKNRDFVYYMVLTSSHGCNEELLDDPVIGFLIVNHVVLEMTWTVQVLCRLLLHECLLEIVEMGPVGVTSALLKELTLVSNGVNSCCVAFATACKMTKLFRTGQKRAASNMERHFVSSVEKLSSEIIAEPAPESYEKLGLQLLEFLSHLDRFLMICFENTIPENFYSLSTEYEKEQFENSKLETPEQVLNILLECLEEMLKLISCDVWISWNEHNNQHKIGCKIYTIEHLLQNHHVEISKTLSECLCMFKFEPVKEEDEIQSASVSELINQVEAETSKITDKWYNALSEREETWKEPSIVCAVLSKIRLAQNPRDIILKSMELLLSSKDASLREAFFIALQSSESSLRMEILKKLTDDKSVQVFFSNEAKHRITTAFNKLSTESNISGIHELITLVIECPTFVLHNVLQLSASSKENHLLCEKIVKILNPALSLTTFFDDETAELIVNVNIFNHVCDKMLGVSHSDREWHNLVEFLKMDFEKPCTFLSDCLISTLENKLCGHDWNSSKYIALLLGSIIHQGVAENSMEVLTAFIAQVLTRCSWDGRSFDAAKAEVYKICCDIVSGVKLCELDSVWLRRILSHLPNYIQAHFCDLWLEEQRIYPKPSKPFLCLLIAARTKSIQVQSAMREHFLSGSCASLEHRIFAALFKILPILHREEWFRIFEICCGLFPEENVKLQSFMVFSNAVTAFSSCWDSETANCVEYCVINLSILFKAIVEEGRWSFCERILMFKLLLRPLESMPVTAKDGCYFLMLPVLLKCVKIKGDDEDGDVLLPFLNSVDETWRDKFQEALKSPWNANSAAES